MQECTESKASKFRKMYTQSSRNLKQLLQGSFICRNIERKPVRIWIVCFYLYCVWFIRHFLPSERVLLLRKPRPSVSVM